MKKFKCKDCENRCEATMQTDEYSPSFCLYDTVEVNWREVEDSEENEHTSVNSEQLPDWCKVGETYYDYGARHYFKVTGIDDEKSEVSISWEPNMMAEVISYFIFKEFARPARKREFNEKEMLDLVGKVVSDSSGGWRSLIVWASGDEITTYRTSYSADLLMAGDYIIDGKPCYVLEHLNEKGEWVK